MTDDTLEPKSKSQLKREAQAAQSLGRDLVELPPARFAAVMAKLDLPANLRDAITVCRDIHAHGARKRQLQYIGKLMRVVDSAPIQQALDALHGTDRAGAAQHHRLEHWRERLLEEGDTALAELLNEYPHADRTQLRQFIAKARKERGANQPPAAARALFRYLRELSEQTHSSHSADEARGEGSDALP